MASTSPLRGAVFLGPLEISGYYGGLEHGLLELGAAARLVTLYPNPFGYEQARPNPWPAALANRVVLRHRRSATIMRPALGALFVLASVLLLIWAVPRYRTFIFSWGMSILPGGADLPILRLLRKRVVVVVGHGSEARPPYMSTPDVYPPTPASLAAVERSTRAMASRLHRIESWASVVVGLPTTSQFLRRPFIDFYALGIPTAAVDVPRIADRAGPGLTVLHVPSKPEVKGTALIRASMEEVVRRHPEVRYVEISGRPHSEVLAALAEADLVIDQAWSDIPMAVVGTEAAALGTATVIAGYAWDVWSALLPDDLRPPTVCTDPEVLLDSIESCLSDLPGTRRLGERAREFVTSQWSRSAVAERYLRLLLGNEDRAWWVQPGAVEYGWGCGVSRQHVVDLVSALVERYGWDALHWPAARDVYAQHVVMAAAG